METVDYKNYLSNTASQRERSSRSKLDEHVFQEIIKLENLVNEFFTATTQKKRDILKESFLIVENLKVVEKYLPLQNNIDFIQKEWNYMKEDNKLSPHFREATDLALIQRLQHLSSAINWELLFTLFKEIKSP